MAVDDQERIKQLEAVIAAEQADPNAFQVDIGPPRQSNTPLLLMLIRNAAERDYNRQLRESTQRRLDWQGTHVLRRFGYHFHANGVVVPRHVRTQCWLKLRGRKKALETMLDFDEAMFERLHLAAPDVTDVIVGDLWKDEEKQNESQGRKLR